MARSPWPAAMSAWYWSTGWAGHSSLHCRLPSSPLLPSASCSSGLGINVPQVFAFTFAFGCGLAGLGGALSAEILGLDPYFPLKFMIYFLIVVTVGGSSSITGPFLASLLLGIGDVAGKYYVPKLGPFVIYTIMIVILIWRPNGLFGRTAAR